MVEIALLILTLIFDGILFLTVPSLSYWILLIGAGFYVLSSVLYPVTFWLISLVCVPKGDPSPKTQKISRFFVRVSGAWVIRMFNGRVEWIGKEKIPEGPVVLVSNHISAFDPITVLSTVKEKPLVFISKEENFKIFLSATFLRGGGYLPIDRENAMRAMRTMKKASDMMLQQGISVGIYPEGTRSHDGKVHEFKGGAFFLAKRANAPIVLIATENTEKLVKRAPFRRTKVRLSVLDVIDRETVKEKSLDEIAAIAHDKIAKAVEK